MTEWLDDELSGCEFKDKRLGDRFKKITKTLAAGCGQSIPHVCEEWAMTKSVYRFLFNTRVDESEIWAGHFQKAQERMAVYHRPVLMLHDTTVQLRKIYMLLACWHVKNKIILLSFIYFSIIAFYFALTFIFKALRPGLELSIFYFSLPLAWIGCIDATFYVGLSLRIP